MISTLLSTSTKTLAAVLSTGITAGAALSAAVGPLAPLVPVAVEVERRQSESVEALVEGLSAAAAHDRAMAACRLGRLRGEDVSAAQDALVALLGDAEAVESKLCREHENWGRSGQEGSTPGREAAIALEEVGAAAIGPVTDVLRNGSVAARVNAAMALGLIEDQEAIDALVAALQDDDAELVRARSAWALGLIEDVAAAEALGRALEDAAPEVREQAAWGLGMIESAGAVPALSGALQDEVAEVREQAAWALGMIEAPSAVSALNRALGDDVAEVREQAAWGLGMIESSAGVPALIGALQDDVADVREQAAWALGMIEDSSAVEALTEALEDDDAEVRKQVLWALMRCVDGDDESLDYGALAEKLRKVLRGGA